MPAPRGHGEEGMTTAEMGVLESACSAAALSKWVGS